MAAVDAKMVKELRDKTAAPMMDCREALAASDGDMEKAIVFLRQKGLAAANKKMDRATKDGKIISYIHPGDKLGVMVKVPEPVPDPKPAAKKPVTKGAHGKKR